jgi:hypothetical protein
VKLEFFGKKVNPVSERKLLEDKVRSHFRERNPNYFHNGKHGKAIAELIKRYETWDKILEAAGKLEELKANGRDWWKNCAFTPHVLSSQADSIEEEYKQRRSEIGESITETKEQEEERERKKQEFIKEKNRKIDEDWELRKARGARLRKEEEDRERAEARYMVGIHDD